MNSLSNRRILLIDDTPAIHEDFRKILIPEDDSSTDLQDMESALFGDAPKPATTVFELDSAYGGQEGLNKLLEATAKGDPMPWPLSTCACPKAGMAPRPSKNSGSATRNCKWWSAPPIRIIPGMNCSTA
ncbi:hypothetical protein THH46_25305 [Pseudomonas sp. NA13]